MMPPTMRRNGKRLPGKLSIFEALETRRLLCEEGTEFMAPVEVGSSAAMMPGDAGPRANDPSNGASPAVGASIIWTNRGSAGNDSDRFESVFGANANLARAVVDGVIQAYT